MTSSLVVYPGHKSRTFDYDEKPLAQNADDREMVSMK
jgi:hypothetical protein